ncbi:MAG TPA: hypothetical protein VNA69_00055 [Thermoanaerobaculia bacterium]|nr:hypothetical protein [Thermoanaerobaculia bacterium]
MDVEKLFEVPSVNSESALRLALRRMEVFRVEAISIDQGREEHPNPELGGQVAVVEKRRQLQRRSEPGPLRRSAAAFGLVQVGGLTKPVHQTL